MLWKRTLDLVKVVACSGCWSRVVSRLSCRSHDVRCTINLQQQPARTPARPAACLRYPAAATAPPSPPPAPLDRPLSSSSFFCTCSLALAPTLSTDVLSARSGNLLIPPWTTASPFHTLSQSRQNQPITKLTIQGNNTSRKTGCAKVDVPRWILPVSAVIDAGRARLRCGAGN